MDSLFFSVLVLALLGTARGQNFNDVNQCDEAQHTVIDEPRRSPGYKLGENETALCDDRLRRGWYRFRSVAGNDMVTTCPQPDYCGTRHPIWLRGGHPTVAEGIQEIELCTNLNRSRKTDSDYCCDEKEDIFVKNCDGFFVYYLFNTQDCDQAYCAGTIAPCPSNKWSPSGFPPCKDPYPILPQNPVLRGFLSNTFNFTCHFAYDNGNNPEDQFQLSWTFNGVSDPTIPPTVLITGSREVTLASALVEKHLNKEIGCEIRSFYSNRKDVKSPPFKSNSIFLGLQTAPRLSRPIINSDNQIFYFLCNVTYPPYDNHLDIEVNWTFDGQSDPAMMSTVLEYPDTTVSLADSALNGHMNTKIGCLARLKASVSGATTAFVSSNSYFAGIRVRPEVLEMSEADPVKNVTVTSTVPIVCARAPDCCVTFEINTNQTSVVSLVNSCQARICFSDWLEEQSQATVYVEVVPIRDVVFRTQQLLDLFFAELDTNHDDASLNIFKGLNPGSIQVKLMNVPGGRCVMTGDPHVRGFDGLYYDLFKGGDFIAYQSENRDLVVHVRTSPCARVACVCGIVIKENNDVIKISKCRGSQPTAAVAFELSEGTIVQRSDSGKYFGIYLPSGVEMRVEFVWDSFYLTLPALVTGHGFGLCGHPDSKTGNDYAYPNGTVDTSCKGQATCRDAFIEAWRVSGNESLFEYVPEPASPSQSTALPNQTYCSCSSRQTDMECTPRGHLRTTGTKCESCPDITSSLKPSYVIGQGWIDPLTGKPYAVYQHEHIPPVNSNTTWPANGMTENEARDLCQRALDRSELSAECRPFRLETLAMQDCLSDILYGGTVNYTEAITASFTTECQMAFTLDPGSYVKDENGSLVLKPHYRQLCPLDCREHGRCVGRGVCQCDEGWEGSACHIQSGLGPVLINVIGESACDRSGGQCDLIHINASNLDLSARLSCTFQFLDERHQNAQTAVVLQASALSPSVLVCPLPQSDSSIRVYNISASNGGSTFGNQLPFAVFDSTCLDCTDTECEVKSTACLIDHLCYTDKQTKPGDESKICDVSKSTSGWSAAKNSGSQLVSAGTLTLVLTLSSMSLPYCIGK